jgi:hypothetical protein
MRDKRPIDELSIEELERILAIRRREARQQRLRRFEDRGRRVPGVAPLDQTFEAVPPPLVPQQHEAAYDVEPIEPPVTYDLTDDVPRFEDEIEAEIKHRQPKPSRRAAKPEAAYTGEPRPRAIWDTILLGIEMIGVAGIVALLILGVYFVINENSKIEALEEQSAQVQRDAAAMRPTPTPMPELRVQLSDYVLPGGHKYNDGVGTFNLDELPESIRPAAVAQLNVAPTVPTSSRFPRSALQRRSGVVMTGTRCRKGWGTSWAAPILAKMPTWSSRRTTTFTAKSSAILKNSNRATKCGFAQWTVAGILISFTKSKKSNRQMYGYWSAATNRL